MGKHAVLEDQGIEDQSSTGTRRLHEDLSWGTWGGRRPSDLSEWKEKGTKKGTWGIPS